MIPKQVSMSNRSSACFLHSAAGILKEMSKMSDPLDLISINDALRVLAHCQGQLNDLDYYFGVDPDEASIPESYLWNCVDFTIQMLRNGIVIEKV